MRDKRAMLLAGVGTLAALMAAVPAEAQQAAARPAAWADRTGFDDYDWIDRADAISEAIGEAPPDTSFAFETGEPWAWTLDDGSVMLVEQLPDGPHGYYFEAGADTPFLVRDPDASFGFIDGAVAVVYGADGQALSRADGRGYLGEAMRGYERGRRLKRALGQRDRQRYVSIGNWYSFSYLLFDWWDDWDYGLSRNPAWRRHHDGPRGIAHRQHWAHERQRREAMRGLFERWGQNGYRGPAPGRFTPPKPGTPPPPHRWDGRGRGDRQGIPGQWHGARRPRSDVDPTVGVAPADVGVAPPAGIGSRGDRIEGASRPAPRPGSPASGYRPRPEPQGRAPEAVPVPPAAVPVEAAPAVERPLPPVRPDRAPGERFRQRPMPEPGRDDAPPRLGVATPRPDRGERPAWTPPAPQAAPSAAPEPTRSWTPRPDRGERPTWTPPARQAAPERTPRPERSWTPSPTPTPSYTPAPAPAPERSWSPSPSPTPTPTPSPTPSPSRSSGRAEPERPERRLHSSED